MIIQLVSTFNLLSMHTFAQSFIIISGHLKSALKPILESFHKNKKKYNDLEIDLMDTTLPKLDGIYSSIKSIHLFEYIYRLTENWKFEQKSHIFVWISS